MKTEIVEKANDLLEEIKGLKKYKELLEGEHKHVAHFEFVRHYGKCDEYDKVIINQRHNKKLIVIVDEIIYDLENELESL